MIHSTYILLAVIALLLLGWSLVVARSGSSLAERKWIILLSLLPPLFVTGIFSSQPDTYENLRVSMEGFRFRVGQLSQSQLTIGGSKDRDHLVVPGLPDGYLRIFERGNGIAIEISDKAQDQGFAMVRFSGPGESTGPFHNSVSLSHGAQVLIGDEEPTALTYDAQNWQFSRNENNTACAPIPKRTQEFLGREFTLSKNLSPHMRMFPIRYYGQTTEELKASKQLRGPDSESLGSFFFWHGSLYRQPHFLLTDPAIKVTNGNQTHAFNPVVGTLGKGESGRISLYRIDYYHPGGRKKPRSCRIQERRSFSISYDKGMVDITLDTPGYVHLTKEDLKKVRQRSGGAMSDLQLTLARESYSRNATDDRVFLNFSVAGKSLDHELFSAITFNKDGTGLEVTTHTGRREYQFGEAFLVGDKGAVKVRIAKMAMPTGLILLVWLGSFLALAGKLDGLRAPIPVILLSFTEFFLAMRLLVGFEAAALDTRTLEGPLSAAMAYLIVPLILQVGINTHHYKKVLPHSLIHIGGVLAALGLIYLFVPMTLKTLGMAVGAALALPIALAVCLWLLDRLPTWQEGRRFPMRKTLIAVGFLVIALGSFRLGTMVLLGWKERMQLGFGAMAVSIYYTPACLWVFAMLWRQKLHKRSWGFLVHGFVLAILFGLLPALARDLGTLLIFPIPVLLLLALPWAAQWKSWKALLMALPFVIYISIHAIIPFSSMLGISGAISGWQNASHDDALDDAQTAMDLLEARMQETHNRLRVWGRAAPDKLRDVGTTDAESLSIVMANLDAYGSRGALGEGYLKVPLTGTLRATHVNDNVSAIHVIATYGWLGSGALLLLLVVFGFLPLCQLRGDGIEGINGKEALGLMCMWTLLVAGLYMFSANVNLLLFTGKNVYFLAATSLSDLVEGVLLVALAAWATKTLGTREVTP